MTTELTEEKILDISKTLKTELSKIIIGQEKVINQLLTAIFANGHCFMVGVPGLGKTLLVSTLAKILDLSYKRIQFTPDLMPTDITGTEIIQDKEGKKIFEFSQGPIFANLILADEINRTPPKTQAALLEAMQEKQVTVGNQSYKLESPFFVLATQNPLEQEGTYPLPEAQLDRFMFNILVDYPDADDELKIMKSTTATDVQEPQKTLSAEDIIQIQNAVKKVPCAEHIYEKSLALIRKTRPGIEAPDFVNSWVETGAGPRAGQFLILAAKAHALLNGRNYVTKDDINELAPPILRHRIVLNFNADADNITTDEVIAKLLQE